MAALLPAQRAGHWPVVQKRALHRPCVKVPCRQQLGSRRSGHAVVAQARSAKAQARAVKGVTIKSSNKAQQADSSSNGLIHAFNTLAWPLSFVVGTPIYPVLEAVVLVGMLGFIDAAYSGDWSRIGVISKETEYLLQKVVLVMVSLHGVTGVAAGAVAQQKGREPLVPAIKGVLFGTLGLYEQTTEVERQ